MFTPIIDRNRTRSEIRSQKLSITTNYTDNFPSATFPRLWNKVDNKTKEIRSLHTFKDTLKTYFLDKY